MRIVALLLLATVLGSCSDSGNNSTASADSENDALSRNEIAQLIERTVPLPKRARALEDYARRYVRDGNTIYGQFLVPLDTSGWTEDDCVTGAGEPCEKGWLDRLRTQPQNEQAAGTSRWYESRKAFPQIMDGGCAVVWLEYSLEAERFLSVTCNGRG